MHLSKKTLTIFKRAKGINSFLTSSGNLYVSNLKNGELYNATLESHSITVWSLIDGQRDTSQILKVLKPRISEEEVIDILKLLLIKKFIRIVR
jgi:hypothetical protein